MVVGEPGIGKTAICEQLATYAAIRSGRALVGHCYEEGSLSCSSKGKEPVCDIREGTLQPCSSKGKEPICDNMERTQGPCSSHGNKPICDK